MQYINGMLSYATDVKYIYIYMYCHYSIPYINIMLRLHIFDLRLGINVIYICYI